MLLAVLMCLGLHGISVESKAGCSGQRTKDWWGETGTQQWWTTSWPQAPSTCHLSGSFLPQTSWFRKYLMSGPQACSLHIPSLEGPIFWESSLHAVLSTPLSFLWLLAFLCDNGCFSLYQRLVQKTCCHGSCWKFSHIDRTVVNWPARPHNFHRGHLCPCSSCGRVNPAALP